MTAQAQTELVGGRYRSGTAIAKVFTKLDDKKEHSAKELAKLCGTDAKLTGRLTAINKHLKLDKKFMLSREGDKVQMVKFDAKAASNHAPPKAKSKAKTKGKAKTKAKTSAKAKTAVKAKPAKAAKKAKVKAAKSPSASATTPPPVDVSDLE
jgi:peptidoglycan hydrolase CwlO-like protein